MTMTFAPASADAAKAALSSVAATVTVITFRDEDGRPSGMTATAFANASYDPVMAVVCVNAANRTYEGIKQAGRFGVNTLASDLAHISDHCARPGDDKTLDSSWVLDQDDPDAPPAIVGALAYFDYDLVSQMQAGSGVVLLGQARKIGSAREGSPLLHHRGSYRQVGPDVTG